MRWVVFIAMLLANLLDGKSLWAHRVPGGPGLRNQGHAEVDHAPDRRYHRCPEAASSDRVPAIERALVPGSARSVLSALLPTSHCANGGEKPSWRAKN